MFFIGRGSAQSNNEWDRWQQSDCYKNIYFRTRLVNENGDMKHWQLQFKNLYSQLVSFNYLVSDDSTGNERINKRKKMESMEVSDPIDYYFHKSDMFMSISQLCFSPYLTKIENCDTTLSRINKPSVF
ncbi:MAG: hypothetical protein DI598_17010 [Pseudopedobacter saltans]|uniref:Uncharacterized protein n=1 Tax=Pseudopedobacter saltans TaxID=151895 RepID=A0A2W5G9Y7_9SPHI|nr:MAG: hypothetical protein DI598_17010 [Pseudopedobacter saltans]